MKDAHTLLRLLTEFIPPPDGCVHNISMNADGVLVIYMHIGDAWQSFGLDGPDDLEKNPHEIFEEVESLLKHAKLIP